jgi:serine/threonine protein kinase
MTPLGAADPTQVGSYRLLGVLGVGGMGRVYLGESRTGQRVAIKVVRADLAADPAFRRRFAREVAAARSVGPIVTAAVVDADTEAVVPWLATSYIDGPNLADLIRTSGPMTLPALLTLGASLADALAAIHRVNLVHRDLKPTNVVLDGRGAHIIDFGIALNPDAAAMTTSRLVGTPSYIAPERIRGADARPASDVFSLGSTLVFAATGRNLVSHGTVYVQIVQITMGRFDLSRVPSPVRPIVESCLRLQPDDRPTAPELVRAFIGAGATAAYPGWYAALRRDE